MANNEVIITGSKITKGSKFGNYQYYKKSDGSGYWKRGNRQLDSNNIIKSSDGSYYRFNNDGTVTTLYSNGKFNKSVNKSDLAHMRAGHVYGIGGWRYDTESKEGKEEINKLSKRSKPKSLIARGSANFQKQLRLLKTEDKDLSKKELKEKKSILARTQQLLDRPVYKTVGTITAGVPNVIKALSGDTDFVEGITPDMFSLDLKNSKNVSEFLGSLLNRGLNTALTVGAGLAPVVASEYGAEAIAAQGAKQTAYNVSKYLGKKALSLGSDLAQFAGIGYGVDKADKAAGGGESWLEKHVGNEFLGADDIKFLSTVGILSLASNAAKAKLNELIANKSQTSETALKISLFIANNPELRSLWLTYKQAKSQIKQSANKARLSNFKTAQDLIPKINKDSKALTKAKNTEFKIYQKELKKQESNQLNNKIVLNLQLKQLLEELLQNSTSKEESKNLLMLIKNIDESITKDLKLLSELRNKSTLNKSQLKYKGSEHIEQSLQSNQEQLQQVQSKLNSSDNINLKSGLNYIISNGKMVGTNMIGAYVPYKAMSFILNSDNYSNLPGDEIIFPFMAMLSGKLLNSRQAMSLSLNSGGKAASAKQNAMQFFLQESGKLYNEPYGAKKGISKQVFDKDNVLGRILNKIPTNITSPIIGLSRTALGLTGRHWNGLYKHFLNATSGTAGGHISNGAYFDDAIDRVIYNNPKNALHEMFYGNQSRIYNTVDRKLVGSKNTTPLLQLTELQGLDSRAFPGLHLQIVSSNNNIKSLLDKATIKVGDKYEPLFINGKLNPNAKSQMRASENNIPVAKTFEKTNSDKDVLVFQDIRGHGELPIYINGIEQRLTLDNFGPGSGSGGSVLNTIGGNVLWSPAQLTFSVNITGLAPKMNNGLYSHYNSPIDDRLGDLIHIQ